MIDIKRLRNTPDEVRANLSRRGIDLSEVDRVVELDESVRKLASERDDVRSEVKALSKEVGTLRRDGKVQEAEAVGARSKELGAREGAIQDEVVVLEEQLRSLLLGIPNEISADVPDGAGEEDNRVVWQGEEREWADHQRVPHWEIGEELGLLDPARAVKLSGSMFNMFLGAGATLQRALCQLALDMNADIWEEIRPPSIVRTETMTSTGHLPKDSVNMYAIERDDLWAIPTAEVPLTSMSRDETLAESALPVRMMAYTPCFRRESGSAGKDTRGFLRVHEFDKVELMAYTTPEQGRDVMLEIRDRALKLFEALGLQLRILEICSGDLGQSHHQSFDIEAYSPGVGRWLELSSCSWFNDYQARRANVRYKPAEGGSARFVHTCNGSALAVPRAFAAVVETHRQPDGSVVIPEVLQPYMRGMTKIVKP